jgi:hypothetical protein
MNEENKKEEKKKKNGLFQNITMKTGEQQAEEARKNPPRDNDWEGKFERNR